MRFSQPSFIVAVFGILFFAGFVNAQVVIFSEDFEGTGGLLNGTAEDISGAVFAANHFATTNGVLDVTGANKEGSATLEINLVPETIYTVELDVISNAAEWIGIGFSENASTGVENLSQDRFAQNGGRAWFLYRPAEVGSNALGRQVEIFGGRNTSNVIPDVNTDFSGPTVQRTLTVILNTDLAGFTADFLIDGVSQSNGPVPLYINNDGTVPLTDLGLLDHVGFTWEGQSSGGVAGPITIDNFSVSSEPIVPGQGPTSFADVTNSKGLGDHRSYAGDIHSPGGVFTDLNNDGYADLYLVSNDGSRGYSQLYLNVDDGNGEREFSLQANALGAANDTGTMGDDPYTQSGENRFRGATGAIAGDYDNDGDLDLYVTNMGRPNRLYQNQLIETGTLSFNDVTAFAGVTGINSLIQAGDSSANTNNSDDALTAVWFDPDRDGDLDLYVGNHNDFSRPFPYEGAPDTFYINNGDGTFTDSTAIYNLGGHEDANGNPGGYADSNAVASSDINNDGWVDLIVTNKSGGNASGTDNIDQIYINNGADQNGTWLGYTTVSYSNLFADSFGDNLVTRSAMGLALADVDNDGDMDIYIADNPTSGASGVDAPSDLFVNLLVETGELRFEHALVNTGLSWGVQIQDFDNDGAMEIHTTNDVGAHGGYSALLEFVDFENLVRARTNADGGNRLFLNIPNGDLVANVIDIAVSSGAGNLDRNGRGNMAADFDRDGRVDMFLVNLNNDSRLSERNDPSVLLQNTTDNTNGFLNIKLIGDPTNIRDDGFATSRDAIGSRVIVTVDVDGDGTPEQLTREVSGGFGNAASTSSYDQMFGVGDASEVAVTVQWADGRVTDIGMVSTNQFLVIDQEAILNRFLLGDANLDGVVNFLDISPFIQLLSTGVFMDEADIDGNGVVNFLDISPFIVLLSQ